MKVVVTGGAGFIGSHLVDLLLAQGHVVTVLDNFSTGHRENLPSESGRLTIVEGDIADRAAVEQALAGQDAFVHLAAVASVEASVQDPVRAHRTNLRGSICVFEAAARLGVRRGLYASSAAVYGNEQALPIREDAVTRPVSPYAIDKLAGEHYLSHFHRAGLLDGTAFRFFNVFGPRQDPLSPYSGVISIFLRRAALGLPITVFGDGMQSRDFVYVEDVAAAVASELGRSRAGPEAAVYNVGRGEPVNLLAVLEAIRSLPTVQAPLDVSFGAPRVGDVRDSLADVAQLRATGWQPTTGLELGLARTLEALGVGEGEG